MFLHLPLWGRHPMTSRARKQVIESFFPSLRIVHVYIRLHVEECRRPPFSLALSRLNSWSSYSSGIACGDLALSTEVLEDSERSGL